MPTLELPVPLPTVREGVQLSQDELIYIVGIIGRSSEGSVGRGGGLNVHDLYHRLYHDVLLPENQPRARRLGVRFERYIHERELSQETI